MKKEVPKFGKHEVIQFVGVSALTPDEQDVIQSLAQEYYEKIRRELHNLTDLVVHTQASGGVEGKDKRKRYSLHVRAMCPGQHFESSKSDDYELPRAVHRSFEEILAQITHKLRTDVTRPKPYQ